MLKLSKLLWVVLIACAFLALGVDRADAREGLASWYGPGFEGLPTASGDLAFGGGYDFHQTADVNFSNLVGLRAAGLWTRKKQDKWRIFK